MPDHAPPPAAAVRAFWSGTITFGLVSIPVDFYAAARARQKAMKMVDTEGHALGRQYVREEDGKPLADDAIVRGFETESGQMVVITDAEFDSAAPETSRDIELARFVPLAQIAPAYFVRPYFLAPAGRSGKAYTLLAATMERAGKVGIGRFVMRGQEYLVALIAEGGTLRAETLRYADELRTPAQLGLPPPPKGDAKLEKAFASAIAALTEKKLDLHELEDRDAEALHALAERKAKAGKDVVQIRDAEDEEPAEGGGEVVDLVALLKRSLGGRATGAPEPGDAAPPAAPARRSAARRPAHAARPPSRERAVAADTKAERPRAGAKAHAVGDKLAGKSREELYAMASKLELPGRSKMSKDALVKALRAKRER